MTDHAGDSVQEPWLHIPRPPRFWTSRLGRSAVVATVVAIICALPSIIIPTPGPVDTIRGIMASKQDFFNDAEVKRLLLEHNIRVEVTARGSSEVAYEVLNQKTQHYDFAFPSGQPAADLIMNERRKQGLYQQSIRLFTSPIVLASYREYAEALVRNGAASRYSGGPAGALYYSLDTAKLIDLGERGKTWNDIGIGDASPNGRKITNGNRVLAHTTGVCRSNSGATYLALIAFVENHDEPAQSEAEADRIAKRVKPLITATGMPESDLWGVYLTPEGMSQAPIAVVYEHEFFAYQQDHVRHTGSPDTERVLLYPQQEFQTDPDYISLRPGAGDRLGRLLREDPALRRRMMELGFRVIDNQGETGTERLFQRLKSVGVPTPDEDTDRTRAELPELNILQRLIDSVGGCPR